MAKANFNSSSSSSKIFCKSSFSLKFILCLALIFYSYHCYRLSNRNEYSVIVLYNRVPKCGSSLMNTLLSHLSHKKGTFQFVQSEDYDHYRLSSREQEQFRKDLLDRSDRHFYRTIIYERHFHFVHFSSCDKNLFLYINQLRDPLKRALSYYDYVRYICHVHGPNGHCALANRSLQNLTMEQCVRTGDPRRCLTNAYGVRSAVSFFCGQLSICDDATGLLTNDAALAVAKHNIEHYYFHVGILEYIENSLELLEYHQPMIFQGITEIYQNTLNRSIVHETPRSFRHSVSEQTEQILRNLLKYEYDLYEFVKQRFLSEYMRTFQRAPHRTRK